MSKLGSSWHPGRNIASHLCCDDSVKIPNLVIGLFLACQAGTGQTLCRFCQDELAWGLRWVDQRAQMLIADYESLCPVKSRRFLPNLSRVLSWFVIAYGTISSIPLQSKGGWLRLWQRRFIAQRCLRKSRGYMPVFARWLCILRWNRSSKDIS